MADRNATTTWNGDLDSGTGLVTLESSGAGQFPVSFTARTGDDTLVKLMTDGILLAEIQRDRLLRRYDTLIIDEAHERSLNIDFILGYLKQLLPRRPDLKVIITSATIDPESFSRHFGGAPVVEVSGRTYPVEVRYRPLVDDSDETEDVVRDQTQAICEAVDELCAEGPGDILVFLSGEREIRDTADALEQQNRPNTEVLPLYARLSTAEQHRVFQPHGGRRIVLATNVAETSLTVPGIKYVIDPGTARISRYSVRTKVQRLPIERISQASANQRSGRCGRVSDGIAIRLYSEEDFLSRDEFTDPEILRTNLASVILHTMSIGVVRSPGDMERFPFVQPPAKRSISDGVNVLRELGALKGSSDRDAERAGRTKKKGRSRGSRTGSPLTAVGRKLSAFPVDPRLGRMIVAAQELGVAKEVMVLAAALTIQDPRERPTEQRAQADERHARFKDETSDFSGYLLLWQYLQEKQAELSSSQFRKMCRREYINYLRVREWQDLYEQLRNLGSRAGVKVSRGRTIRVGETEEAVHRSLLAGLLSHIGLKDQRRHEYQGARGTRFSIFPGSSLFKKNPDWIVSAELVETSKLWARVNASVDPRWIEEAAGSLLKHTYSEPYWSAKRGSVMAYDKATLFGVPVVTDRPVNYWRSPGIIHSNGSGRIWFRKTIGTCTNTPSASGLVPGAAGANSYVRSSRNCESEVGRTQVLGNWDSS